ncbi:Phosphate regulon sensor protein PhoR [compost metagenome]
MKNALDHTEAGGSITIEWDKLPANTQITVKDNGSGIHNEDIYHIFKRFYRSRFSKDLQGIGLGLSLTKAIVGAHEGMITVDSVMGSGSTFVMSFIDLTKL